jgi:hypothetical protein
MKIKRHKRVRKHMQFYSLTHNIRPPYKVLRTFACAFVVVVPVSYTHFCISVRRRPMSVQLLRCVASFFIVRLCVYIRSLSTRLCISMCLFMYIKPLTYSVCLSSASASVCVCVCVCLSVSLSLSVCVCVCVSLSRTLSRTLSLSLELSLLNSLSLS